MLRRVTDRGGLGEGEGEGEEVVELVRRRRLPGSLLLPMVVLGSTLLVAGCHQGGEIRSVPGGNPAAGRVAIRSYGCGACHTVPGVRGANGLVGPPLTHFAQRSFIAGEASNTASNLIRWIQAPESIEPGTAMPNLGVTENMARDMAAYLYTLR